MSEQPDNTEPTNDESHADEAAPNGTRVPWLTPFRWKPGQSGNPSGRPREAGSLAAALRRVGIKPAKTRTELTKLAQQLGMNPDEAQNIDVVAGLVYDGITQLLIRTVKGSTGAGDKLVGLLQLLFKALDGDERRITFNGPGDLHAALISVSSALGFGTNAIERDKKPSATPSPLSSLSPGPPDPDSEATSGGTNTPRSDGDWRPGVTGSQTAVTDDPALRGPEPGK